MPAIEYDIITVGGGLGGASLARSMAERGARVLVLERETRFRDRVRGEAMAPWGVAEAKLLGIHELLFGLGGRELRWADNYMGPQLVQHRDLIETTPQRLGWLTFYHPAMQEKLLAAVARAGAEVQRGVKVTAATAGAPPSVEIEHAGSVERVAARLVVGADGRSSMVRKWAGFTQSHDAPRMLLAGLLFEGLSFPEDTFHIAMMPGSGHTAFVFPQGGRRVRAYFGYHKDTIARRIQGDADVARFIEAAENVGLPRAHFAGATAAGPLASFDGADNWVEHPCRDGVVLVGDAAATSDPTWGQGLSLTARDVRVLRDCLIADDDWQAACDAYAAEHDRHYGVVHRTDCWMAELFLEIGSEADARRARAMPLIAQDPDRIPDVATSGPEAPSGDEIRRRFFGED